MSDPVARLLHKIRVTEGAGFALADFATDTEVPPLADGKQRLAALQEKFAAQSSHALLCIFQGMDAAGKDGTIKHVLDGVDPQGVQVTAFKVPDAESLAHDFLWRVHQAAPARGVIGIFNRSQYEDVLVSRVHDTAGRPRKFWRQRLEDMAGFERHLCHEGTLVLKFFLHVSKDEQKKRLLKRLDNAEKHWKFSNADLIERRFWAEYVSAYEEAIAATATKSAPWFIVPADDKASCHVLVMAALIAALEELDPHVPASSKARAEAIAEARRELLGE